RGHRRSLPRGAVGPHADHGAVAHSGHGTRHGGAGDASGCGRGGACARAGVQRGPTDRTRVGRTSAASGSKQPDDEGQDREEMTTVFVSHPQDKLEQYFGPKAVAALQTIAEVRFNPNAHELAMAEPVAAARGSDVLIAYRQTPGPERLFRELPPLAAFLRCAVA